MSGAGARVGGVADSRPGADGAAEGMEAQPLLVTGLASGGEGVARLPDGRVVFVEDAVPGDRVELSDLVVKKKLARARIARLVEASPDRVEPRCAHFGRCGGCSWQHIRYARQLEAKRDIVCSALERIGRLALPAEIELIASPEAYAYRARARLVESADGLGYRRRGAREVETVVACPVLLPALQSTLDELGPTLGWAPATEPGAEPAEGTPRPPRRRGRDVEWTLTSGSSGASGPVAVHRSRRGGPRVPGPRSVEIEVLGEKLRVSGDSFLQANALLWDALAGAVRELASAPLAGVAPERFLELYAGVGFLSIPLARRGLSGAVIESDRAAVADLRRNLALAGLADRVEVIASPVERRGDLERRLADAQVLLVDPPRVGLASPVRRAIAEHGPDRVVVVSCDPATLARDLRELVAGGYRLRALQILDLFPQTPHVESVALLERG